MHKMLAYYLIVGKGEVIETNEGEYQRLEMPDKFYKRVIYLETYVPQEFIEQELERQLQKVFERMKKDNETGL